MLLQKALGFEALQDAERDAALQLEGVRDIAKSDGPGLAPMKRKIRRPRASVCNGASLFRDRGVSGA